MINTSDSIWLRLFIGFCFFVPYLGHFTRGYQTISLLLLAGLLSLFLSARFRSSYILSIFGSALLSFAVYYFGLTIEDASFSDMRELLRIETLVLSFLLFKRLPTIHITWMAGSAILLFTLIVSIFLNYDQRIGKVILNLYGATPQFDWSYSRYRNIFLGGQPAISGYLFAMMTVLLLSDKIAIRGYYFLVVSVGLFLVLTTLSKGALAFLTLGLLALARPKSLTALASISCVSILAFLYFSESFVLERFFRMDTFFHRLDNLRFVANEYSKRDSILNFIFGCMFSRECMYTGSWRSISLDGSFYYILSSWGVLSLLCILLVFCYEFSINFLSGCVKANLYLAAIFLAAIMDPLLLDPKLQIVSIFTYFRLKRHLKYASR